ncbi:MAG: Flp family type IVb pilin [Actinomycetota bacterium]|nr:Flp family type IVb pilin [Actinomycetota bacterium]
MRNLLASIIETVLRSEQGSATATYGMVVAIAGAVLMTLVTLLGAQMSEVVATLSLGA